MTAVLIHKSRNPKRGGLWQGGAIDVAEAKQHEYQLIVLCAEEWQPEAHLIAQEGCQIIYAPNDDSEKPLTRDQIRIAIAAAREVRKAYESGKNILSSCMQGRNRSGLVTALSLHLLYGISGRQAKDFIRTRIDNALSNIDFQRFLAKIPARVPTVELERASR